MASAWNFAARGEGTDALEIDVFGAVGRWADYDGGLSARGLNRLLKSNTNAKTIKLRINSEGGSVIEGFAIYNQLVAHDAEVEVEVVGLAASMATILAMAASPGKLRIAGNAWFMIHNPWSVEIGDAEQLRSTADVLDKMAGQLTDVYVARSGMDRKKIVQMMDAETWMTAQEAKANGFVDAVGPAIKQKRASGASANAQACASLRDFSKVPPELLARFEAPSEAQMTLPPVGETPANNTGKDGNMNEELKTLLAMLGVASVAEATTRIGSLAKLELATGKLSDEAHGTVLAWKASHDALPAALAKVAELEKAQSEAELDKAIVDAKAAKKLTPAEETTLREQVAAGDVSLKGAKAMLATKAAHAALVATSTPATASTGTVASQQKPFAEMTGAERAALKRSDPELYAQLREEWKAAS